MNKLIFVCLFACKISILLLDHEPGLSGFYEGQVGHNRIHIFSFLIALNGSNIILNTYLITS